MKNQFGTPFVATMTAGTTPVVATQTGVASQTVYITDISGSSDLAGSTIILANGGVTVWKDIVGAGNYRMNFITPIKINLAASATVTVTATANGNANMSGFILNNT